MAKQQYQMSLAQDVKGKGKHDEDRSVCRVEDSDLEDQLINEALDNFQEQFGSGQDVKLEALAIALLQQRQCVKSFMAAGLFARSCVKRSLTIKQRLEIELVGAFEDVTAQEIILLAEREILKTKQQRLDKVVRKAYTLGILPVVVPGIRRQDAGHGNASGSGQKRSRMEEK